MRKGPKVTTRSFCVHNEVYEVLERETVNLGYGSQSQIVNLALRRFFRMKPRQSSHQRESASKPSED